MFALAAPAMPYNVHQPRPHQQAAVAALHKALRFGGRAQVIHACGAGKTRTAAMFVDSIKARCVLVTLPSLGLVKQTMDEWLHQFGGGIDFRAVCSDRTVTPQAELVVGQGHVLSDPRDIAMFMASRSTARVKVVFSTYQSTPKVAEAVTIARTYGWDDFDVAICDEAHRLAGKPSRAYNKVLYDEHIPIRRRVFMTATPRVTHPGKPHDRVIGMDNTRIFGTVVHRYTFAEATRDGVLTPYKLTILGIDPADLSTIKWSADPDDAEVRHHIGLVATLRMMHTMAAHRMVTYHTTQARAERFTQDLRTLNDQTVAGAHVPDLAAVTVHGSMPSARREVIMNLLKPEHRYPTVVSNPKVLTEGIDVPALDGVVFVDPRNSMVDTVQAIGRALRTAPGKTVGHIIIPVLMRPGDTAEEATKRGGFTMAWRVLAILRDMDSDLAGWIDNQSFDDPNADIPDGIEFTFPGTLTTEETKRLALVAKLRMVNQISAEPGPDTIEIKCQCCHQFTEERIYLNGNDPLRSLRR